jgi:apolipoprotein D and lipocalin family protein
METINTILVSMQVFLSALLALSFSLTTASMPLAADDRGPVVTNFELDRYVGRWYELARIDNRFERGMTHVTATYSKRDDGRMGVLNKGWETDDQEWSESDAYGWFAGDEDVGSLRVRFFWPFSAEYRVVALEANYQWAIVVSKDLAWILHREPEISFEQRDMLIETAREAGVAVDELLWIEQANRPAGEDDL